jgi:hypothetical protein
MTDANPTWIIPIDDETRAILADQGVADVPQSVTLRLRPATLRDLRQVDPLLARSQQENEAAFEAGALVITRRADPPVSIEVAREIIQQLHPHELGELILAYRTGERDASGKLKAGVDQTLNGMTDTLLSALAAGVTPSSSGSTG